MLTVVACTAGRITVCHACVMQVGEEHAMGHERGVAICDSKVRCAHPHANNCERSELSDLIKAALSR